MTEPLLIFADAIVRSARPDHKSLLDAADPTSETLKEFYASPQLVRKGIELLRKLEFEIGRSSVFGFSFSGRPDEFEAAFGISLSWKEETRRWTITLASAADTSVIPASKTPDQSVFAGIVLAQSADIESNSTPPTRGSQPPPGTTALSPSQLPLELNAVPVQTAASAAAGGGPVSGHRGRKHPLIAFVDTGTDFSHPYFAAQQGPQGGTVPPARRTEDSAGYIEELKEQEFIVARLIDIGMLAEACLKAQPADQKVKLLEEAAAKVIGRESDETQQRLKDLRERCNDLLVAQGRTLGRKGAIASATLKLRQSRQAFALVETKHLERLKQKRRADPDGHGSMVASLIVAIAPLADLLSIRLSYEASNARAWIGDAFRVMDGLETRRPNVISMSSGLTGSWVNRSAPFRGDAAYILSGWRVRLAARHAVVVLSAGNAKRSSAVGNVSALFSRFSGVLAVGGVHKVNGVYHASNTTNGYPWTDGNVHLVVPTVCAICGPVDKKDYIWTPVPSDLPEGTPGPHRAQWAARNTASSGAAAQVAGVCALVLQEFPNASPDEVKQILVTTAQEIDPANGESAQGSTGRNATGAGVVQIDAAVAEARKRAAAAAAPAAVPTGHGTNVVQVVANGS